MNILFQFDSSFIVSGNFKWYFEDIYYYLLKKILFVHQSQCNEKKNIICILIMDLFKDTIRVTMGIS